MGRGRVHVCVCVWGSNSYSHWLKIYAVALHKLCHFIVKEAGSNVSVASLQWRCAHSQHDYSVYIHTHTLMHKHTYMCVQLYGARNMAWHLWANFALSSCVCECVSGYWKRMACEKCELRVLILTPTLTHTRTYIHCHSAMWVCSKKGFRWRLLLSVFWFLPSDFCFLPAWLVNGSLFYVKQKKAKHW